MLLGSCRTAAPLPLRAKGWSGPWLGPPAFPAAVDTYPICLAAAAAKAFFALLRSIFGWPAVAAIPIVCRQTFFAPPLASWPSILALSAVLLWSVPSLPSHAVNAACGPLSLLVLCVLPPLRVACVASRLSSCAASSSIARRLLFVMPAFQKTTAVRSDNTITANTHCIAAMISKALISNVQMDSKISHTTVCEFI